MKAQLVLLIVLFLGSVPIAKAQKFDVPKNYELNSEEDFKKYEPELLQAIDWFERTPWDKERFKKIDVVDFLMDWIEGCPYVEVETSDDINALGDIDHDALIMYFAGYTRYVLQNPGTSKSNAHMAGMKALLARYEKDKVFIKDKSIDRLAKLDQQGGLQAWLSEQLDN